MNKRIKYKKQVIEQAKKLYYLDNSITMKEAIIFIKKLRTCRLHNIPKYCFKTGKTFKRKYPSRLLE